MIHFISCDWGTSSFRLRLIEIASKKQLAETRSAKGIAATYALWKEQSWVDSISFYSDALQQQIKILEEQTGYSLDGITVIISGMASSTIGMMELPYKPIPYNIKEATLKTHLIAATATFRHDVILVSGVCSSDDVIRGEETILAGCDVEGGKAEQLFIFPGTHSKHVTVKAGMIQDIKTFMTGEIFALLSTKSILSTSVEKDADNVKDKVFIKGVKAAQNNQLLNNIFHVRTNTLFGKLNKEENYHYLSGLIIGEELKSVAKEEYVSVTIVSTGELMEIYGKALTALGLAHMVQQQNADDALIKGQVAIAGYYQ